MDSHGFQKYCYRFSHILLCLPIKTKTTIFSIPIPVDQQWWKIDTQLVIALVGKPFGARDEGQRGQLPPTIVLNKFEQFLSKIWAFFYEKFGRIGISGRKNWLLLGKQKLVIRVTRKSWRAGGGWGGEGKKRN